MAIEKGRGRFVWFDLFTTDPAAARAFYGSVIGWSDEVFGGHSHVFRGPHGLVAGSEELSADARAMGAPPHWLGYIGTPSVEETTNKAQALGARLLVPPTDIPTIGRFSVLQDPQGAVFAPFTSLDDAPGHEGMARLGEIGWHELSTTDPTAALAFYGELFGWTEGDTFDMGPQLGPYRMFKRPGAQNHTGGVMMRPPGVPVSNWLYYVRVPSAAEAIEAIVAGGGEVLHGPQEVPGGDIVVAAMDPQGAAFAVVEFPNDP